MVRGQSYTIDVAGTDDSALQQRNDVYGTARPVRRRVLDPSESLPSSSASMAPPSFGTLFFRASLTSCLTQTRSRMRWPLLSWKLRCLARGCACLPWRLWGSSLHGLRRSLLRWSLLWVCLADHNAGSTAHHQKGEGAYPSADLPAVLAEP